MSERRNAVGPLSARMEHARMAGGKPLQEKIFMSGASRTTGPVHRIDAVGLTCPMPVLMTRKALRGLPSGAILEVRATDPLARIDIPHFCTEYGHTFLEASESDGILTFRLRKGG